MLLSLRELLGLMQMPGAVLVLLWHQEELYLSAVGFPFVTNELGEVGLVFIQAEAVVFLFIQGAGEEVVPCVTEGILQHHGFGAAECLVQLVIIVLLFFTVTDVYHVRVTVPFERYDLVYIFPVLVNAVRWRNAHGSITSRKSLWSQVAACGALKAPHRIILDCAYHPDIHQ